MDLQFVLDPYAAVVYMTSYLTKGQVGVSMVMDQALKQARKGDTNLLQSLVKMGSAFIGASVVCAQEAVNLMLGNPIKRASRACVFIPTCP